MAAADARRRDIAIGLVRGWLAAGRLADKLVGSVINSYGLAFERAARLV